MPTSPIPLLSALLLFALPLAACGGSGGGGAADSPAVVAAQPADGGSGGGGGGGGGAGGDDAGGGGIVISSSNEVDARQAGAQEGGGASTGEGGLAGLRYTDFGTWAASGDGGTLAGPRVYAVGQPTPLSEMPVSGSAEYRGGAGGIATLGGADYTFTGDTSLRADFASGAIDGRISGLVARHADGSGVAGGMNDIQLAGSIDGSRFSGSAAAIAGPAALDIGAASGGFAGQFNGPQAAELGGTFAIEDGEDKVTGAFGAAR